MSKISVKKVWIKTDAWRGYERPIHAVCGANNTGNWDDSPCPTNVCNRELRLAGHELRINRIPYKRVWCRSSNVFCVHGYIVVPEEFVGIGKELIEPLIKNTRLLYVI